MSEKLELVREQKLHRLLPGMKKSSRLEASGVALLDDSTAAVVFDNLNQVARIDLSLEPHGANRLFPVPSLGEGFEDIAIDHEGERVFCLIEALEEADGLFRGFIAEYHSDFRFIRCTRLHTPFEVANKGFEGLAHVRHPAGESLYALCESRQGTDSGSAGGGRIDVFVRAGDGGWSPSHELTLPETAEFEDFAALAYRDGRIAVVSQASARLWTARVDVAARALVPGSEAVHRFPAKGYCNVEGIAWLSEDTLVAVSDRKKGRQPERCCDKDQSIHVFRIPPE